MADATAAFFQQLAERGPDPLLDKATGTVRLEFTDAKRADAVLLRIEKGVIELVDEGEPADLTFRSDRATFEGIARGRINPVAAILRGAVTIDGDLELAVLLQRVFPSPPRRGRRSNGKTSRGRKA